MKNMADKKKIEAAKYTPEEVLYRSMIISRMNDARDQRDAVHDEFDGMTYLQWRESNLRARNAYLRPKKNEQDTRVVTGTTREKANTFISYILNLNLESDIEAYDKEDMVVEELGNVMEDLVKKSYKMESPEFQTKEVILLDEFVTQGTVVAEEKVEEFNIPKKELESFDTTIKGTTWSKRVNEVYKTLSVNPIDGSGVFYGNIREPFLEKQPYIIIRRLIPRTQAQAIYGKWERWENVPEEFATATNNESSDSTQYNDWTLYPLKKMMVEEVRYFDKWANDFMVMLNGVMMFPVRMDDGILGTFPLSGLLGRSDYPLSKGDYEGKPNFAYSTSIPAKTKFDQAILDEMFRAIILKTQKSFMPPMASKGKNLSKKIFNPGNISTDVDPEKIKEIGENKGVTQSEYNVVSFLKGIIDEKTVSPVMEGQLLEGRQTATEIIELKKQAMMKAGLALYGWIAFKKRLTMLRIYNIMKNWTDPIDVKMGVIDGQIKELPQYRSLSVDTSFEDGTSGQRVVRFQDEVPPDYAVAAEEELTKQIKGKEVRINVIDPAMLKTVDYTWYCTVEPTEKETGMLRAAKFEEFMAKALALGEYGKQANVDYLGDRLAIVNQESPEKVWAQEQQANPMPMQEGTGQGVGGAPAGRMQNALPKPSQSRQLGIQSMIGK